MPARFTAACFVLCCWCLTGCRNANSQSANPPAPATQAARLAKSQTFTAVCAKFADPQNLGQVIDPDLAEISGAAASAHLTDVLWVHNDHDNKGRVYAIDRKGQRLASYRLKHVPAQDWEDIARGPCKAGDSLDKPQCIYVADTGDNHLDRSTRHILRWHEPQRLPSNTEDRTVKVEDDQVEVCPVALPDGTQDIEALIVLPDSRVIMLSKRKDGTATIYRATLTPGKTAQAEMLGALVVHAGPRTQAGDTRVTAADLHPDGKHLLVRTYSQVLLYDIGLAFGASSAAAAVALQAAVARALPTAPEPHGEAIAWDPAGGYFQLSDSPQPFVWHVACAP